MCGLAGYLGHVDAPERLLGAMADAIAHRGPDGRGIVVLPPGGIAPGAGLSHVRLSIVGLSDSQQPMKSEDGSLVIAFNGEIFNYVELRDELIAAGHRFRTSGDTEVLLRLYEIHGEACLDKLNGDFAFAIWDGRAKRMMLARDRIGVRPLFYTEKAGTLYFASEIKALLTIPGFDARLDAFALDQIFTLWSPMAPRTAFEGVFELEPGTFMMADASGRRISTYWSLDFPEAGDNHPSDRDDDKAAQLRALLEDATRIRLRADVPVGSCLSGGLDSSIVAALAADMAPRGLDTFAITFDSAEHDESGFQQLMARHLGVKHHEVNCSEADIAAIFPDVVRLAEKPLIRTAPAPMLKLSGLIRQTGMKVVLTGEGADEVFAGYDIFKEARVRRFCARQPGSRMRPHLFRKLYPYLPGLQKQSAEYLAAFFGADAAPLSDPLFSHRPRLRNTAAAKLFFSSDLKARLAGYDAADEMAERLPSRFGRWHPLHQAQYLETRFLLPGYILSSQGDRMAMGNGVEGRFPFLDHRLVEFAATLSPAMKLKGLKEKYILRQAMADKLPNEITHRVKQPYRAPDSRAFSGAAAQDVVRSTLDARRVAGDGFFNAAAVEKLAQKCAGQVAPSFRDDTAFIGVLSTQMWLDTFTGTNRHAREAA
jgi:asparagine synthase (glutamine-hydrolysing)